MVGKIKYFDDKNGCGFIEYKINGDVLVNFGVKNKKEIETLNIGICFWGSR